VVVKCVEKKCICQLCSILLPSLYKKAMAAAAAAATGTAKAATAERDPPEIVVVGAADAEALTEEADAEPEATEAETVLGRAAVERGAAVDITAAEEETTPAALAEELGVDLPMVK
jgi:hypothetical protein